MKDKGSLGADVYVRRNKREKWKAEKINEIALRVGDVEYKACV